MNEILPSPRSVANCPVCGATDFSRHDVLWPELVAEWDLSLSEAAYINDQQGYCCNGCQSNLRSMTLAAALVASFQFKGLFMDFCAPNGPAANLDMLEINEAGSLSAFLAPLPHHRLARFPEFDMQRLSFDAACFDVVIHSDTLEHVPDPIGGLTECHRVLRPGGRLAFTIPIIVGRLTRRRAGMKDSFHGQKTTTAADYRVETEYGADFWCELMASGFRELSLHSLSYPASVAIVARKA